MIERVRFFNLSKKGLVGVWFAGVVLALIASVVILLTPYDNLIFSVIAVAGVMVLTVLYHIGWSRNNSGFFGLKQTVSLILLGIFFGVSWFPIVIDILGPAFLGPFLGPGYSFLRRFGGDPFWFLLAPLILSLVFPFIFSKLSLGGGFKGWFSRFFPYFLLHFIIFGLSLFLYFFFVWFSFSII